MNFSRCWWSAKGKRACSPNSPDFDSSEPEEMNDPADDINFDAAFVKDSESQIFLVLEKLQGSSCKS
jgi:hypothetical protein